MLWSVNKKIYVNVNIKDVLFKNKASMKMLGYGFWEDVCCHFVSGNVLNWKSSIFHLVPNEVKFCLKLVAPVEHSWVLAQFDTTLVILSNCYWIILSDDEILQKIYQVQSFLNWCCHALIFCLWRRQSNCDLLLDTPFECCGTSVELEVLDHRWFSVVDITRIVCISLHHLIIISLFCVSKF